jgi:predicted secreted protein
MRTFLFLCAALMLLVSFSADSLAGENANLKFIGFSGDGKYLAFEEYGTYDGSGLDFSTTYFIDTVKNSFALPPVAIDEGDTYNSWEKRTETARVKKLRATLANNLRKLNIVAGNTGALLVSHLLTDFSYQKPSVPTDENTEIVKFNNFVYVNSADEGHYELILKNIPAAGEQSCDSSESNMLELTLLNKTTSETIPPQILQKDATLPARRSCPFYYRIERVYFYGDKIAVFLNYFNQGFEGRSMRYLAVTAQMNYQPLKDY